jgi:4-carboxymuconolactone decarboxylase
MHVAIYAGVPAANRAIKIIKQTYADMERQPTTDDRGAGR